MKKKETLTSKQYKLTRDSAPLSYMLPTRNSRRYSVMYFDEDLKTNRALRYATNQKSPFEDEQDGNAILDSIIFEDGFLNVPKENQILQEFLYLHPLNGKKFVEIDEAKDAAAIVEMLNIEVDALIEARQLSIDMIENVSRVLFGTDTTKTSNSELRRDILVYAKREPEHFLSVLGDPMLKLQANVALFFDKGFLTFRKSKKEVWYNTKSNKTRMLAVPYGEDAMFIVASYLQSDEGIDILKMLENLLEE